jgi:hypothetical protein
MYLRGNDSGSDAKVRTLRTQVGPSRRYRHDLPQVQVAALAGSEEITTEVEATTTRANARGRDS